MFHSPDISIIIPTFNRPENVKRAARSVLRQTYDNWELIVVNDGDDMRLAEFVDELNDHRIVYTPNLRNKGGNGARNTGAVLAKADYIALLDDDDEWHKDKIDIHLNSFKKAGGHGASICGFYHVPKDFDCSRDTRAMKPYCFRRELTLENMLLGRICIGGSSTFVIEKVFFMNIGMMNETLQRHQDLELMIRMVSHSDIHICHDKLVYIHGHNDPPLEKIEQVKQRYWALVEPYLEQLPSRKKKKFFAHEYKGLSLAASGSREYGKMFYYLRESLRRDIVPSKKYLKVFYYMLRNLCKTK